MQEDDAGGYAQRKTKEAVQQPYRGVVVFVWCGADCSLKCALRLAREKLHNQRTSRAKSASEKKRSQAATASLHEGERPSWGPSGLGFGRAAL